MINYVIRFALLLILLVVLQVLLFNNIQFSGYINPYVYVMFILLLPVTMPQWLLLLIAFFTGLIIDLLSGTPGMHAGATVAAGFSRPYLLRVISPRDGYENGAVPGMAVYGFRWFLIYTLIFTAIHHFALFYLEVFRLSDFFRTLLRVIISTIFSSAFIILAEYYRKGR